MQMAVGRLHRTSLPKKATTTWAYLYRPNNYTNRRVTFNRSDQGSWVRILFLSHTQKTDCQGTMDFVADDGMHHGLLRVPNASRAQDQRH